MYFGRVLTIELLSLLLRNRSSCLFVFSSTVYSFVLANARIVDYPIVYCNEGFSRLTGYSRVEIMQKSGSCAFFYGEQTTKDMRERLPFWLLVCVAPVRNECEEVVLFLLAFRDITALKTPFDDEDTVKGKML
ncbi:unnamed protein product [Schistosoma mattheei]|uniref:Uncharacterized protein n=1 Tax=Schistosoma mattheei TaxID=31246 RepID=A0A183PVU0_9TREM|nr:unnamed protein product [Schistosoma mattheei]